MNYFASDKSVTFWQSDRGSIVNLVASMQLLHHFDATDLKYLQIGITKY
jgi:hypothetical protein